MTLLPIFIKVEFSLPPSHVCVCALLSEKCACMFFTRRSPEKPVLVFVASRRQTRLTAVDLISLCARADSPRRFVRMPEEEAQRASESVRYGNCHTRDRSSAMDEAVSICGQPFHILHQSKDFVDEYV